MKGREFKEMSEEELVAKMEELEKEEFGLIFRHKTAQQPLDNPTQIRNVRRDIARCKTEMRERELRAAINKSTEEAASV